MIGQPTAGELIDEGSTIIIECVTQEGNPAPQVTWTKDGSNLDTQSEIFQNVEIAGSYNTSRMKSIITIQVSIFINIICGLSIDYVVFHQN